MYIQHLSDSSIGYKHHRLINHRNLNTNIIQLLHTFFHDMIAMMASVYRPYHSNMQVTSASNHLPTFSSGLQVRNHFLLLQHSC